MTNKPRTLAVYLPGATEPAFSTTREAVQVAFQTPHGVVIVERDADGHVWTQRIHNPEAREEQTA